MAGAVKLFRVDEWMLRVIVYEIAARISKGSMHSVILTHELANRVTPRAGRVLLQVPPGPKTIMTGETMIVVPDVATDHKLTDTHQEARVIKVGYGEFWEDGVLYPGVDSRDFIPGDWIIFRPILLELNAPYVLTDVRRVDAVILNRPQKVAPIGRKEKRAAS